ncbi:hypothetical protein [Streptomyces pseudogriseolus]|uniref:hypothetical protein n=1 Tax=Streptomyces pseudogriseolus TaxID=36817 RepID=UPI003FA318AB
MRRCAYCGDPITADEDYKPISVDVATGAGGTVFWHVRPCKRAERQTYPVPSRRDT